MGNRKKKCLKTAASWKAVFYTGFVSFFKDVVCLILGFMHTKKPQFQALALKLKHIIFYRHLSTTEPLSRASGQIQTNTADLVGKWKRKEDSGQEALGMK